MPHHSDIDMSILNTRVLIFYAYAQPSPLGYNLSYAYSCVQVSSRPGTDKKRSVSQNFEEWEGLEFKTDPCQGGIVLEKTKQNKTKQK